MSENQVLKQRKRDMKAEKVWKKNEASIDEKKMLQKNRFGFLLTHEIISIFFSVKAIAIAKKIFLELHNPLESNLTKHFDISQL